MEEGLDKYGWILYTLVFHARVHDEGEDKEAFFTCKMEISTVIELISIKECSSTAYFIRKMITVDFKEFGIVVKDEEEDSKKKI